jgi:hypothetical protein
MSHTVVVVGRDRPRKRVRLGGITIPEGQPISAWVDEPEDPSNYHDYHTAPERREFPPPSRAERLKTVAREVVEAWSRDEIGQVDGDLIKRLAEAAGVELPADDLT